MSPRALSLDVSQRFCVHAQVFNSRTCQLVLGAGALAAAGLRSITAKHLAMAAQCLGAVIELHPALTAAFTAPLQHARRAILLPDFERVLQACSPQQRNLHAQNLVHLLSSCLLPQIRDTNKGSLTLSTPLQPICPSPGTAKDLHVLA